MSLMVSLLPLSSGFSEKPVDEGESDEDEDGEESGVVRTSDLQAQLREVARSGKGKVCLFA